MHPDERAALLRTMLRRDTLRLRTMLWRDTYGVLRSDNVRVLVHVLVPEATTDYSCTETGTASR